MQFPSRSMLSLPLVTSLLLAACGSGGIGAATAPASASAPVVVFQEPARAVTLSVATGGLVQIVYVVVDADSDASTDLVADRDGDISTTADQITIESARIVSDATPQQAVWDVAGVPPGTYRILARSTDGSGTAVAEAAGSVQLNAAPMLEITSPVADVVVSRGGLLTIGYRDRGPDAAVTTLLTDDDGDGATTADQTTIAAIPVGTASDQERTHVFDTSSRGLADFAVLGTSTDGLAPPAEARAAGRVRIDNVAFTGSIKSQTGLNDVVVEALDTATLPDGSTYVTGRFEGNPVFGEGQANETTLSTISGALFIARYRGDGTLLWVRGVDDADGRSVVASPDGSCLVGAVVMRTATFGRGEVTETTLPIFLSSGFALARYGADGSLVWARLMVDADSAVVGDVGLLPDGSIVAAGTFRSGAGTATFGAGEVNETRIATPLGDEVFLARFDATGDLLWVRAPRRSGGVPTVGGIAANETGIALAGGAEALTFAAGSANETTLASAGSRDVFVARYGLDGTFRWARFAGGTDSDRARRLAMFADGSVVAVGEFRSTITFAAGEAGQTVLGSVGDSDVYAARYDATGTLSWARRLGGGSGDTATDVTALSDGSCVVVGLFAGAASLAESPDLVSRGLIDHFLVRFAADGALRWARAAGSLGNDGSPRVAAYPDGSFALAAAADGEFVFDLGEASERREDVGILGSLLARVNADGRM